MPEAKKAAPAARLNQDIPFELKLSIESLNTRESAARKQRVNQKDLVIELLEEAVAARNKKLDKQTV